MVSLKTISSKAMDESPSDREASPDWLRTFQTPSQGIKMLSSSSPSTSSHDETPKKKSRLVNQHFGDALKEEIESIDRNSKLAAGHIVDLDSASEGSQEGRRVFSTRDKSHKGDVILPKGKDAGIKLQTQLFRKTKEKLESVNEDALTDQGAVGVDLSKIEGVIKEEDAAEGQERRTKRVLSTLPLVLGDKVHRSKVLLECEGDALDLSGDAGAVGRLSVLENNEDTFLLDLKGIIHKATIVPSNTLFVVNIGPSEAKVEAVMSDFVQLQPYTNIFEAETMVEGTLEGFGFDSDDEHVPAPIGAATVPRVENECEDGEKWSQQKARSGKTLKVAKGSVTKPGKAGTSKNIGKRGVKKTKLPGKSAKKSSVARKIKPQKQTGK